MLTNTARFAREFGAVPPWPPRLSRCGSTCRFVPEEKGALWLYFRKAIQQRVFRGEIGLRSSGSGIRPARHEQTRTWWHTSVGNLAIPFGSRRA